MEIKKLDECLINMANSVSFNGNRGRNREIAYESYANEIISWDISKEKKKDLLEQLYKKNMDVLRYEAAHVSMAVAGPARYNSKKLDKSDKVLELSSELYNWFERMKKQYNESQKMETEDQKIMRRIKNCIEYGFNITKHLEELGKFNVEAFIKIYEKFYPEYKWRKNSNIYKMYKAAKEGKLEVKNEKILFQDENYRVYSKKDRIFIKFVFEIKNQLRFALKRKGFFWNSYEKAWSTYPYRYEQNKEWTENISEQYKCYI